MEHGTTHFVSNKSSSTASRRTHPMSDQAMESELGTSGTDMEPRRDDTYIELAGPLKGRP